MAWDLAISTAGDLVFTPGDLIFSPSADVQGISGVDLVEQRMLMRMKLHRNSWTYDEDGTFGSQLYRLVGTSPQSAESQADAYVREALREIRDIEVDAVNMRLDGSALILVVDYHILEVDASFNEDNQQQLEVVVATSGGA